MHFPSRDRRPEWAAAIGQLMIALFFLYGDASDAVVMSPSVYGNLAYNIDASIWAEIFLVTSTIYIIGLHQNGRMPLLSPILRISANSVLVFLHLVLGVSAFIGMLTDQNFVGAVVFGYALFMMCPIHGCFLVQNMGDYRKRKQRA